MGASSHFQLVFLEKRYQPNLRVHFRVSLTFVTYPNMVPEAVPTWPQLAAVIPTLNVPGRCSSLDGIRGDGNPKILGIFSAKF